MDTAFINGTTGGDYGLGEHLSSKHAGCAYITTFTPEQIDFQGFKIHQV